MYLTAGTHDDPIGVGTNTHIFCGSGADWDRDMDGVRRFDERSS
ncbi:hypothetical protein DB30_03158 [Enhygromyxa salina]|uniref:Uncharacterized protein n=1 Tax=Enhygromyxa salina TaxID=215803 RepID=A0A0C2DCL3_9BACT|nr:hypothetical protein DB30_03158 [Enhygromyxa salina]